MGDGITHACYFKAGRHKAPDCVGTQCVLSKTAITATKGVDGRCVCIPTPSIRKQHQQSSTDYVQVQGCWCCTSCLCPARQSAVLAGSTLCIAQLHAGLSAPDSWHSPCRLHWYYALDFNSITAMTFCLLLASPNHCSGCSGTAATAFAASCCGTPLRKASSKIFPRSCGAEVATTCEDAYAAWPFAAFPLLSCGTDIEQPFQMDAQLSCVLLTLLPC